MWKSYFILIFSICSLFGETLIEQGDLRYIKQDYIGAIKYYKEAEKKRFKKAKLKLKMSYLKLANNFNRIREYEKALKWYKKAKSLNSHIAKSKILKIYEKQGDDYFRIKKYKKAKSFYLKALTSPLTSNL